MTEVSQYWSWVLAAIGLLGFWLSGRKVWWSWYINVANQALWFTYAIVTDQYGFIVASIAYTVVFGRNAYIWTKDRVKPSNVTPSIYVSPYCGHVSYEHHYACVRPKGHYAHNSLHGYAGIFWKNDEGYHKDFYGEVRVLDARRAHDK